MTPDQEITAESAVYARITQQLRSLPQIPDPSGIYIAGIFTPTATCTNLVTAAAPKVQLALKSVSKCLITAVPMEDLACGSLELSGALERVMEVYQEVYHPRVSTLESLQVVNMCSLTA